MYLAPGTFGPQVNTPNPHAQFPTVCHMEWDLGNSTTTGGGDTKSAVTMQKEGSTHMNHHLLTAVGGGANKFHHLHVTKSLWVTKSDFTIIQKHYTNGQKSHISLIHWGGSSGKISPRVGIISFPPSVNKWCHYTNKSGSVCKVTNLNLSQPWTVGYFSGHVKYNEMKTQLPTTNWEEGRGDFPCMIEQLRIHQPMDLLNSLSHSYK